MNTNLHPHKLKISQEERISRLKQSPKLIWFTGLSGSGKSTLANGTESYLHHLGFHTFLLDGDNIRTGLNKDLGFADEDRKENIRRIAEVSKLFLDAGIIVISAFISPFIKERDKIRQLVGEENFLEIFVDCPIEVCESRDVKGLYGKARKGLISNFTGIDSPYESPTNPLLRIDTSKETVEDSLSKIIQTIERKLKFIS